MLIRDDAHINLGETPVSIIFYPLQPTRKKTLIFPAHGKSSQVPGKSP